ncbi:phosphoribosylamine--glycine ligase [Elusimicrobium posterum]|uniref:phosphoribosylamine--glycine ligase n=1 Tax=Elusimicrobium posterum TaxID=3116653 RepID=UPI003C77BAB5
MIILVVGSGGREHALAWKMAQSDRAEVIYSQVAAAAGGKVTHIKQDISKKENVLQFCKENLVDLVVVGPEAPLADGLADLLRENNIKVFGPTSNGAKLENSKEFSKNFMIKYGIPTAAHKVFTDLEVAKQAVSEMPLPLVVKADGLAAGKGVRICLTRADALEAVIDFMDKKIFGNAGNCVVVEEFLVGKEVSMMAFVDGENYLLMPTSRDHKRLLDDNRGPNTGGMGAYSPVEEVPQSDIDFIKTNVYDKVLKGLKAEGVDFCGIIYAGMMMTDKGPKVLEFNCRFGDPEAQVLLPMIKNDLVEIFLAATQKKLNTIKMEVNPGAALCVVLAAGEYPTGSSKGKEITGLENVKALVFHAATTMQDGKFYTNGGRIMAVAEVAPTMAEARRKVYYEIEKIRFEGMQFRKDIGEVK